ncbi:MAG: hypothetical protein HFH53_00270 [Hespellia sp.]|nr:hypothetical protein [Hespellia sp.]
MRQKCLGDSDCEVKNPEIPFSRLEMQKFWDCVSVIITDNCLADCISGTGFREFGVFELNGLEGFPKKVA